MNCCFIVVVIELFVSACKGTTFLGNMQESTHNFVWKCGNVEEEKQEKSKTLSFPKIG